MTIQNNYISSYFHLNPNCTVAYGFVRTHINYNDTVYIHYTQKNTNFYPSERNVFARISFRTDRELECVGVVYNTVGSAYFVCAFASAKS